MQSGKLNTGSRIQTFLRCFALSFDFALSSQNLPMEALQELSMMKLLLKKKNPIALLIRSFRLLLN